MEFLSKEVKGRVKMEMMERFVNFPFPFSSSAGVM